MKGLGVSGLKGQGLGFRDEGCRCFRVEGLKGMGKKWS